ncbi:MAG: sulfurtransferase, partial [Aliifodinibius sp.]|nr:sulfurtransferase [Fodinibius sp.]NIV13113.1 sulfurtransferase [Fodinibius sp.]NIY29378.1 sulfurtransferase [Fodinibius sp.]
MVSTEWVDEHKNDDSVRLLEVDVDTSAYEEGHIPGAAGLNWETQLNDNIRRDILTRDQIEELASDLGITR